MNPLFDFVLMFLKPIVSVITPTLKDLLKNLVDQFVDHAKTTPNPFDDILADFLSRLLE